MSLIETVQTDLVTAMKAQDKVRTGSLRMLKAALKNAEIEHGTLDDAKSVAVVMKLCKQRRESIEVYEKNGRQESADAERAEMAVLEAYLPKAMSEEELTEIVRQAIAETGATTPKQMGQVVGAVMKKIAGKGVDGKKVQEVVKALLV